MTRDEYYSGIFNYKDKLVHQGIKGQKWGVRRWQYADGRFNDAGKERYFGKSEAKTGTNEESSGTKKSETNLSNKAADIYKNYKPNEWNIGLNRSNLSSKEWYKLKTEMNNKLYSEDKKFSKIINDKDVQSAMQDYINTRNEINEEEKRVFSEEFRNSNPKARDFDGDAWEYWHEFADPNIIRKNDETYKNLKEAISKKSTSNLGWTSDIDTMNKVVSDIKEACERGKDSDKIYDLVKENMGIDLKANKSDSSDNSLPSTPLETLNNDNDFVDGGKESKADKKAIKEAKKLEKEFMAKRNGYEYPDRKKIQDWIEDPKNKEFVDSYLNAYDKQYSAMSKEINELFKDYDDHDDDYYAKAAIYEALESNGDNLGDISSTVRWFVGDDGDQGSRNSRAYYLQEKGMSVEDIQELWKRQIAAENRARVDARLAIHEDKVFDKLNPNLQTAIDSELYWKYARNDNYTNTKMGDASEALGQDKAIVKKTQDIAKKLSPSCNDFSGWMVLNRAIENLNFDDKDYTELTDADWNRINAEVKELKAKY